MTVATEHFCGIEYMEINNQISDIPSVDLILNDKADVWKIKLDSKEHDLLSFEEILSQDEKIRADKFCFEKDRRRFIVARAILRKMLSSYLNKNSKNIKILYTEKGKPILDSKNNETSICFNVSHSHELALYAVSYNIAVGIDVEYIRSMSNGEELAKRFFSARENEFINSFPYHQRQKEFLKIWTIKEAYLKATGEGISGLEDIEILIQKDNLPILQYRDKDKIIDQWLVYQLKTEKEYVAALVVKI